VDYLSGPGVKMVLVASFSTINGEYVHGICFLSYKDMCPLHEWQSLSARRSAIRNITHNRLLISMT